MNSAVVYLTLAVLPRARREIGRAAALSDLGGDRADPG
jgi:hypothetical protein